MVWAATWSQMSLMSEDYTKLIPSFWVWYYPQGRTAEELSLPLIKEAE